CQQGYNAPYSF
nr:immunoglobulin light chain junction region [Macaca mulatta]